MIADGQRGSSLVELMTSTLFVSIIMAMSYTFARSAFSAVHVQEARSDVQEASVMALDIMAREIRLAGFSAAGGPITGIRSAAVDHIEVGCDLNGDGDVADASEIIAYAYNPTKQQITRATGAGAPQPFVRNVPAGGLRFAYFDAAGAIIAVPTNGLSASDCKRIRRVDLEVHVRIAAGPAAGGASIDDTIGTSVCLRNQ